ncbi:hypothetical protein Q6D67_09105 [Haliea sp. E1-2-M8]|uniref:hypothetical protein n=1 Tax=Haliea sp. E1-2-M8 TaxID=3064706 RepID=UPI0027249791|nr:hypothetical protein [Haliea sp. E1-2-M8]MDO8861857.1 hypothetical protein [Haliea sp. E1-2-M8]
MITTARRALYPALLLTLGLGAGPASADIAQVVNAEGDKMTFEYQGDQLRIDMNKDKNYMLVRGEEIYAVTDNDGEIMVIDVKQTLSMFGNMAQSAIPDMAAVNVESLEATGRSETVAGIQGEVYKLTYTDQEGKRQQSDLVLSADRRAMGFRDAVHRMASTLSSMLAQQGTHDRLQAQLAAQNLGVLRYGEDMRVTAITETQVADARFVLPAEPTDLSGLGGLFGAGAVGGGDGGFMSGILGSNNAEKAAESAEGEEEAANPVENAGKEIGKALGKLFGN